MTEPKKLAGKLAEVMAAVARVPKRGRNSFHGYDYATEADIAEAVRHELSARHVVLIPEVVSIEHRDLGLNKKGELKDPLTILHMTFTFYDGESGEAITKPWIGVGQDGGDKGAYKAMTGAAKYFLMKSFLLPTGDDPEADSDKDKKQKPVKVETRAPKSGAVAVPQGAALIQKTEQLETSAKKPYWHFVLEGGETLMTWKEGIGAMAEQACQNGKPVRVQVRGKYEDMGVVQSMTIAELPTSNGHELSAAEIFNQTVPAAERGF